MDSKDRKQSKVDRWKLGGETELDKCSYSFPTNPQLSRHSGGCISILDPSKSRGVQLIIQKNKKKHCRIFRKQHHYQHLSQGAVTNRGEVAVPFVMSQMGTHPYKFAEREIMSFSNLPGVRREGRRSIKKQNKNVAHSFNRTLKEAQHKRDNTDGNNSAVCVHIYEYKREKAYKATRRKKKKPHKGE